MKKIKIITQINKTECGICAIAMILNYYGANYSVKEIRERFPINRDGMSLAYLSDVLLYYGLETNIYKANLEGIKFCLLPAIVTWEDKHYVVLERISKKYYYIVDPDLGRCRYKKNEFEKYYSGIFIEIKKTNKLTRIKKTNKYVKLYKLWISKYRKKIFMLFIFMLCSYITTLLIPFKIQGVIDDVLQNNLSFIDLLELNIFVFFNAGFFYIKNKQSALTGINVCRDVNKNIILSVLNKPFSYFETHSNSEILFALDNTDCIKNVFINFLIDLVFEVGLLIVIFFYFIKKNKFISAVLLLIAIVDCIVALISQPRIIYKNKRLQKE